VNTTALAHKAEPVNGVVNTTAFAHISEPVNGVVNTTALIQLDSESEKLGDWFIPRMK